MKQVFLGVLTGCLISILTSAPAWAQATAQISGTVRDQSDAVLPGVSVTVTQTETGIVRSTVTNATGFYVLPNLPLGPYRFEAALQGFGTYAQSGIVLQVNSSPVIDPVLRVDQVAESIQVTATASVVETRSTALGTLIENTRILELPLNGRNVQDLIEVAGGAVNAGEGRGSSLIGGQSTQIAVGGGAGFAVDYTLDGASHVSFITGSTLLMPFPDAIQEIKVERSGVTADRTKNSAVTAVTKSGTNAFHGGLFEFLRHWGLDQPLHTQYVIFLSKALQGDFGNSWKWPGYSAMGLVQQRLPATLQLAGFALGISILIALPIGVLAAVMKGSAWDSVAKIIALLGQSLPAFWLGIVLMWIFAVHLGWFPTSGRGGIEHMVLPAITLGWFQVAAVMRLVRSSMLEVLDSEFVKLSRIKGLSESKVVWKHCLRNAAIAPLTFFAIIAGVLMTGAVVTESVFSWPGTGLLVVDAVRARDFQVVQAVVIVFAGIFILTNLVVDVLYAYLDPRIRYQ